MIESGVTIGSYRVVRELGSGATGTVFLAERIHDFNQTVVLKVLRWTPIAEQEPIEGEHVILRSLEHPNIVALLDHGRSDNGAPFLVLEYLDGKSIDAWCDSHRMTVRARLALLMQVFSAVSYAHSRLVLHGDIKPANVMVIPGPAQEGHPIVKLLDFGISRWLHKRPSGLRPAGATVAYASPEQRRGDPLTVAADVFGLGVLMRSLLSAIEAPTDAGKPMSQCFQSLSIGRQREIAAHRATTPRALKQILRGALDGIVEKATAPAPEERYVSVMAMAEDVNRYMENVETSVYPLGRAQQTMLWLQRHSFLAGVTATMFTILLTSGSLTLWRHHRVVLQERATHARLLELVQLTGDLSGTLYRSTESLAGSEAARASLLRAASAARDSVAQERYPDPTLSLELARQYAAAAELEVVQDAKETGRRQAAREIDTANALLKSVPDGPARAEVAKKINRLQVRLSISS